MNIFVVTGFIFTPEIRFLPPAVFLTVEEAIHAADVAWKSYGGGNYSVMEAITGEPLVLPTSAPFSQNLWVPPPLRV
jgi:hypothetical protein